MEIGWPRRLPPLDNQAEDKHVESVQMPLLDEGSTPSSSTFNALFNPILG